MRSSQRACECPGCGGDGVITRGHKPSSLKQWTFLLSQHGRPESEIKVPVVQTQHSSLCLHLHMTSSPCAFCLLQGHFSLDLGPTLTQDDLILMTSAKTLFQIIPHSKVLHEWII